MVRKRFWLLLAAAVLVCLPFHPPAWHAALRAWLVWQARRHGCDLTIDAIDGGLFDTTRLHGVRCRQHGRLPPDGPAATDVFIARADLTLAWTVPWFQRPAPSWVRAVVLEGVRGRWDLHLPGPATVSPRLTDPATENQGVGSGGDPWRRVRPGARRDLPVVPPLRGAIPTGNVPPARGRPVAGAWTVPPAHHRSVAVRLTGTTTGNSWRARWTSPAPVSRTPSSGPTARLTGKAAA